MKKYSILFAFFIILTISPAFSSIKVDSLLSTIQDTSKIDRIKELCLQGQKLIHPKPNDAIQIYTKALELTRLEKDRSLEADIIGRISYINRYIGNFDKAIELGREATEIYIELQDSLNLALMHNNFGVIYRHKGNFDVALENYITAEKIYQNLYRNYPEDEKMIRYLGVLYIDLGLFYAEQLKQYDNAIECFNIVKEKAAKINDYTRLDAAYANIGMVYQLKKEYDKAIEEYIKALEMAKEHNNPQFIVRINNALGVIYLEKKDYKKSREYLFATLERNKIVGDNFVHRWTNEILGNTYFDEGKYDKAIKHYTISKKYAIKINSDLELISSYKKLVSTYEKMGQIDSAFYYLSLYSELDKEFNNEESKKRFEELQVKYDTEKKENENKLLKKENELHETQRTLFVVLIIILIILLIISIRAISLKKKNLKQSQSLLDKEKMIKDMEIKSKEKENQHLQELHIADIKFKNSELTSAILNIVKKNDILFEIKDIVKHNEDGDLKNEITKVINGSIDTDGSWQKFRLSFNEMYPDFFNTLNKAHNDLTNNETKLCAFLLMKLTSREIANIMNVTEAAVSKNRNRLRKKLNIAPEAVLYDYLHELIKEHPVLN